MTATLDKTVREAVRILNDKHIKTNSSEGGGTRKHGAPDFTYIEAKLNPINVEIAENEDMLPDKIYDKNSKDLLFDGSAQNYAKKSGFYVIGFNRKGMNEKQARKKIIMYANFMNEQKD